jgi:hypothetical protein
VAVPLFPSLVAVIVALPAATPVTTPDDETVAIAGDDDDHVMARPASVSPLAPLAVAASVAFSPMPTLTVAGETVTLATGAGPDGPPLSPPHAPTHSRSQSDRTTEGIVPSSG